MSHYRKQFLYFLGLALVFLHALPALAADADLILKNGRIWTGDPENPWAEAIAIRGSRIIAVGNNQPVAEQAGPNSRVIDLSGRLAIPGFNDAYMHFLEGSLGLTQVNLNGACSVPDIQKRVRDWAASHPKEPWITGTGWQYGCFPDHAVPTKQDLDAAVRDRPVFLRSDDGHAAWVNSKALQLAAVAAHARSGPGPVPPGSQTGEPGGFLKDGARTLVERLIPEPSREKRLAALEQGLKLATSLGITSIQSGGGDAETLSLFDELERQRKLTARVNVALSVSPSMQDDSIDRLLELKQNYHSFRLRAGAVRFVLDGTMESHTAAMLAPYSDASNNTGKLFWTTENYNAMVTLCDSGGFEIFTHAAGDRAVRMALDAYEDARRTNGSHDARFRISQVGIVSPQDIPRFARLGVLALMQPVRAGAGEMDVLDRVVGPERMKLVFPWHSLEQAGARLIFSSGWPVPASADPLRGIYAAVTRQAAQRVGVETALRAYTVNGAYASFEERMKGKLKAGMLADVAVLSQDIFSVAPEEIDKTKVDLTIFDGQVIYTR